MGKRWSSGPFLVLLALLVAGTATARDKKAQQLAVKGARLATDGQAAWKSFLTAPAKFPEEEMEALIQRYEKAIDLFHGSLEIEEHRGLNGQILLLARRLRQLRFEELTREAQARRAAAPKPQSEPGRDPPVSPVETPEETDTSRSREPDPRPDSPGSGEGIDTDVPGEPADPRQVVLPELVEPAKVARRNTQRLRNFLMHDYFANRKQSKLIKRCARCNGRGKVATNVLDRRRRPVTIRCSSCQGNGMHLQVNVARKGFWLCNTPLYRSSRARSVEFQSRLEGWRSDPRTLPEMLKSLRIVAIDYHGLWAVAKLQEKGYQPEAKRAFRRSSERKLVRLGHRWYFFDEEADAAIFSDMAGAGEVADAGR